MTNHDHLAAVPHYVYKCFDATGRVAYVGCTSNLIGRLEAHQLNSWWSHEVVKVKAKVYPTRADGRAAERRAIREDDPRFNVNSRFANHPRWTVADFDDYIAARIGNKTLHLEHSWVADHLTRVRKMRDSLAARSVAA